MTRKKKSPTRRTRQSHSRRKPRSSDLARFFKAFSSSALLAFGLASLVLQPQWREHVSLEPLLAYWNYAALPSPAPVQTSAGSYVQTRFAECRQIFPPARMPVVPAAPALRELCFDSFAILHSGATKTPVFAAQRLNSQIVHRARSIERRDRFYAEARLPSRERSELADYRGSGYARGHMAPAGDMHTPDAMAQSFSLANMVPQNMVQNSGAWNRIEQDTRKYVMRARGDVYVFTGPVYGPGALTIGERRVAVPDYLYKLVHDAATGRTWVHWQANDADARPGPPISYEAFVQRTGLHLLGAVQAGTPTP